MRVFGIGTDIVDIGRMRRGLQRHGERFARRILAAEEMEGFHRAGDAAAYLARRFAAKEAAAKAMGTGFRDGLFLRHIAVTHDPLGRPQLSWSGRAAEWMAEHGITASHLSLADERDHALAFVVLEIA